MLNDLSSLFLQKIPSLVRNVDILTLEIDNDYLERVMVVALAALTFFLKTQLRKIAVFIIISQSIKKT